MRQSSATDVTYLDKFYPEISHRGRKSLISDFDILGIFVNKKHCPLSYRAVKT